MRTPKPKPKVFLDMAFKIAELSKDDSTQCGAVLVDTDNVILATGYNGPPPQMNDEFVPWNTRPDKYAYIIHADENALLFALGSHGAKPLIGSTMYLTALPCPACTLRIIRAGVKKVVVPSCHKPYKLSGFQTVSNEQIIDAQTFPKLDIQEYPYDRK